ncbi:hypothetical protein N8089_01305 [Flavobacteriales bacterium]|nr:hypothetical protein [Flavobacteriales bacterium]
MHSTAPEIELKSLSPELLDQAYQNKWFKAFVLNKWGGLEATLAEGLQIIQSCSKLNGSFGWCINLGAGANYFSGFYSEAGANKIFSDPKCVLAGSGGLATEVKEVEGGFLVSGKWGKATGTDQATYFTCNGKLPSGEMVSLTLDSKDVHVYKDWNLSGMKSSSSFGFSANEAFVPNDYVFKINGSNQPVSYGIHQLPFEVFAQFCMTAAALGLSDGIIEQLKGENLKSAAEVSLENLKVLIADKSNKLKELADHIWSEIQTENQSLTSEPIAVLVKETALALFNAVNQLYFDAGLLMADERKPAHHQYKDFMLAIQHSIFK